MIFNRIVYYKKVTSTNSLLSKLVKGKNIDSNLVLVADFQTEGKGQREKKWHSVKNKNLLFSVYISPDDCFVNQKIYFNIISSLSIVYTLQKHIKDSKIQIKWPNDILVDNHKISGILIETTVLKEKIKKVIIGVGININQVRFPFTENNPTSIKKLLKKEVEREVVLIDFLKNFSQLFESFKEKEYEFLNQEYLSFLRDSAKFFKNRNAN